MQDCRLFLCIIFISSLCIPSNAQDSTTIAVFYYSRSGHTKAMAEAVQNGVRQVNSVKVRLIDITQADREDILAADAIILGSPVYNGNVAPPVLQFINSWPFEGAPLQDKIGAVFVSAGGISAGEELVQMSLISAMLVNRMIIVGGPEWQGAFGASAVTGETPFHDGENSLNIHPAFLKKATALGKRVAEIAKKFKGQ